MKGCGPERKVLSPGRTATGSTKEIPEKKSKKKGGGMKGVALIKNDGEEG